LLNIQFLKAKGNEWNYQEKGPDYWSQHFLDCKGEQQSPINIQNEYLNFDKSLAPFNFIGYDQNITWHVLNNGLSSKIMFFSSIKVLYFYLMWL